MGGILFLGMGIEGDLLFRDLFYWVERLLREV